MVRRLALAALLLASRFVYATSPEPDYILLPVVGSGGASSFGHWRTSITCLNLGDSPAWTGSGLDVVQFAPHSQGELSLAHLPPEAVHGLFLYGLRPEDQSFFVQSRTYLTSQPQGGVVLPGIRISTLGYGPVHLIGIPVAPTSRTLLRVYEVSGNFRESLALVHIKDSNGVEISTAVIDLITPNGAIGVPQFPSYAELPVTASVPSVSIDVEPLTPFIKLWAFTTTTDNETQSVVAVLPVR